jgi:GNAT superfamily N-acetyltransferase
MISQDILPNMTNDEQPKDNKLPPDVARLEGSLALHDGSTIRVRAIRAEDDERLRIFHRHLSPDSIMFRFFHFLPELPSEDAAHFTHVDYLDRMALIATMGEGQSEEILGVVRYDRIGEATAEVAFVVLDRWQGHGIATALLHRLASYARTKGFVTFIAITMGNNSRMIEVLRNAGFPWKAQYNDGTLEVVLDITEPPTMPDFMRP